VTGETFQSVLGVYQSFKTNLVGMDSACIDAVNTKMDRLFRDNGTAKAGVDIALYDIAAQRAGVPLYKYLGGSKSNFLVDKTIAIGSVDEMVADELAIKKQALSL